MYCHTFVSPAIGATVQTFFFLSVLMMLDLPVLGYPTKPTEICFLSECKTLNCRSSWIRDPFPNELLMEAWNAIVGASLDKIFTHRALRGKRRTNVSQKTVPSRTTSENVKKKHHSTHPKVQQSTADPPKATTLQWREKSVQPGSAVSPRRTRLPTVRATNIDAVHLPHS